MVRCYRTLIIILGMALYFSAATENICNEEPPENRYVDGIPAYDQCSESDGSVYSSNGIDTRDTREDGWVRTQWSGGYQCTELAHRYLHFIWSVESVPNGNAGTWCDARLPEGLEKTEHPVHGDLIIFAPGVCGAGPETGHVAVVDIVKDSTLTIVEQNRAGRRKCKLSCAECFLHAEVNGGIVAAGRKPELFRQSGSRIQVLHTKDAFYVLLPDKKDIYAHLRLYTLQGQLVAELSGQATDGIARFIPDATLPRSGVLVLRTVKKILHRGLFVFP